MEEKGGAKQKQRKKCGLLLNKYNLGIINMSNNLWYNSSIIIKLLLGDFRVAIKSHLQIYVTTLYP